MGEAHTTHSRTAAPASSYLMAAQLLSLQDWALLPCLTWSWQTLSSRSICVIDGKTDALTANPLATRLQFRLIKIRPVLLLADGTLVVAKPSFPPICCQLWGPEQPVLGCQPEEGELRLQEVCSLLGLQTEEYEVSFYMNVTKHCVDSD